MNTNGCESNQTTVYLSGEMTSKQERAYLQHLDICTRCQAKLESLAADEKQWSDVKELLTPMNSTLRPNSSSTTAERALPLTVRQVIESLLPTDDPDSLGRIDNFEVTGVIGSGAMGVVLKAEDPSLNRIVALKVMNPLLAANGTARTRFAREAKAAAAILHPNVIAIHGVNTNATLPYLVMPYLKGMTLQQRVDRQGPLSVAEILRIGCQIASGLEAAHQQGVIHRDIKPSNIMLDADVEAAIITDFGLARTIDDATMTRTGVITGTPEFMSPEQARGESIGHASDLFSLGSLLYMLCTGHPPFRAQSSFGILRRITDDEPMPIRSANSEIPSWLSQIVQSLQAKSPETRPNASETHALLESCLAHVYQPDQIPLPETCRRSKASLKTQFFSYAFFGVIPMFVLVGLIASVVFLPTENDDTHARYPDSMPSTIQPPAEDSAKVFKTLDLNFPVAQKRGTVTIDITRGFVEVATHDQPNVVIEVLYPPEPRKLAGTGKTKQQFAPNFDLDIDKQANQIKLDTYNQDYVLNLRVKLPKQSDLSLDTYYDGYLRVTGVEGTIITHSQNCDISLHGISGSAKAYSYNGDIKASFEKVAENAELDFESYNGSIDLAFSRGTGITAGISAGRGTFGSEFELGPVDRATQHRSLFAKLSDLEYNFSTINGGGIPLRIESKKGIISIRETTSK